MEVFGALKDLPCTIEWKHFQAAAPVAESLNGNAIDLGFLGDSALLVPKHSPVCSVIATRLS